MGKPGVLQFLGLQGVRHNLETEQQQEDPREFRMEPSTFPVALHSAGMGLFTELGHKWRGSSRTEPQVRSGEGTTGGAGDSNLHGPSFPPHAVLGGGVHEGQDTHPHLGLCKPPHTQQSRDDGICYRFKFLPSPRKEDSRQRWEKCLQKVLLASHWSPWLELYPHSTYRGERVGGFTWALVPTAMRGQGSGEKDETLWLGSEERPAVPRTGRQRSECALLCLAPLDAASPSQAPPSQPSRRPALPAPHPLPCPGGLFQRLCASCL